MKFITLTILMLIMASHHSQAKPNILFILADDLGYADIGVHGCKDYKTPHIDSIFNNGVRFTQGYVTNAVCAPSRAGLITGRLGSHFGFEKNLDHKLSSKPGSTVGLPLEERTIADVLKPAGYKSYCIGKWHLGDNQDLFHPLKRGFDHFYGLISGSRSYWKYEERDPIKTLMLDYNYVDEKSMDDFYVTDSLTDQAIEFIKNSEKSAQPFFMYLSYTAPHGPMHAKQSDLARVSEKVKNKKRRIYSAMVMNLDDNIGRVLACLDELKITENTMLVFLSDNGGPLHKNGSNNGMLNGRKSKLLEGGIRVPFGIQWRGKIEPGQVNDTKVISVDLLPTFAAIGEVKNPESITTDGLNLMPLLTGKVSTLGERVLYWKRGESGFAIQDGKYKLYKNAQGEDYLFDINADIREAKNLLSETPEIATQLQKKFDQWKATLPPLGPGIGAPATVK